MGRKKEEGKLDEGGSDKEREKKKMKKSSIR